MKLQHPNHVGYTAEGKDIRINHWARKAQQKQLPKEMKNEKWHGKLLASMLEDDELDSDCSAWMT